MPHSLVKYLILFILPIGCVFGRENMEKKAFARVKRDFNSFERCHYDESLPVPRISVGEESFYDWLGNEIQYQNGNQLALEHELFHWQAKNATKACLEEQAASYRTFYYKKRKEVQKLQLETRWLRTR